MPIYEFQCRKCRKEFEVLFRSFREERKVFCPQCGNNEVERLLSLFGFKSVSDYGSSSAGVSCSSCSSKSCNTCNQ